MLDSIVKRARDAAATHGEHIRYLKEGEVRHSLAKSQAITSDGCDSTCFFAGEAATCRTRVLWSAANTFKGKPKACALAHSLLLSQCHRCSGCALSDTGCSIASLPTEAHSTAATTTTLGYDCQAGYNNWQSVWSESKQAWCCETQMRGCTMSSKRYDCYTTYFAWEAIWSANKKAWCCTHRGRGCPETRSALSAAEDEDKAAVETTANSQTTAPSRTVTTKKMVVHTTSTAPTGRNASAVKRESQNASEEDSDGSTTSSAASSSPKFDCMNGYPLREVANAALQSIPWNRKREWCCEAESLGCPPADVTQIIYEERKYTREKGQDNSDRNAVLPERIPVWLTRGPPLVLGLFITGVAFGAVFCRAPRHPSCRSPRRCQQGEDMPLVEFVSVEHQ